VRLNESVSSFATWINNGFILPNPITGFGEKLKVCFISLCRPKKISVTNGKKISKFVNCRTYHTFFGL
jgi:hypothetical protein